MKHDFREDPDSEQAKAFRDWLETETVGALGRDRGDTDAFKATVFLFTNRAYEAGLPDAEIAEIFGRSLARAGFGATDEQIALDWLDHFASIAQKVHPPAS